MPEQKATKEQMLDLFNRGMNYAEIGKELGVSRQRVFQVIGSETPSPVKHFDSDRCIYPGLRYWLNKNRCTCAHLARLMGYTPYEGNYARMYARLAGSIELRKCDIDKIIKITGMSYEQLFGGAPDDDI